MSGTRLIVAVFAVYFWTVFNVWLIESDAQNQWWIPVIGVAGAATFGVILWANGLLRKPRGRCGDHWLHKRRVVSIAAGDPARDSMILWRVVCVRCGATGTALG